MNNYSYITLLLNDSYAYGVLMLSESLKKVNSKYPLACIINEDVSAPTIEFLHEAGVKTIYKDTIPTPSDILEHNIKFNPAVAMTWEKCWTKFSIFDLVEYDKIVFLDADVMVLKNLDHLFLMPSWTSALDGDYFNLWPNWDHFNTGVLVIKPSHEEFNKILDYANSLKAEDLPEYAFADQEVLNFYFKDWPKHPELRLNKYYDVFPPYVQEEQLDDLKENCYFVHFVGRKPWSFFIKSSVETYSEYYYTLGKNIIQEYCNTFDWKKVRDLNVLTVYAICKNEMKHIVPWLNSFGEADHICILDTGSTDGTYEFLKDWQKEHPNLIIDQKEITPWRFDTARNESMKLIPEDTTIFFMADIDEIIKEKGWCNEIKSHWAPDFNRGSYKYNRDVDQETDVVIRTIPEYRIHSKEWDHWINIVHEAIINKRGEKFFYVETCTPVNITVWHYPSKKEVDYMALCEQDLEQYPNDWIMRLQLAIEYEIKEEDDKAFYHFNYIITHENTLQSFEIGRCYYGIGRIYQKRKENKKALNYFSLGRIACPQDSDNYMGAAYEYVSNKLYNNAIIILKEALHNSIESMWCTVYDIRNHYPYYLLALCYYNTGKKLKALACIEIAYARNPNDKDILNLKNTILAGINTKDFDLL